MSTLRIISGSARGRRIKSVPGDTTRPVTDRVKEALFNILAGDVLDSTWWDLFGGTGAIGIEALSRGAAFVRFSDLNRLPIEIIKENLQTTGFSKLAEVRRGDAYKEMWSKALTLVDEHSGWVSLGGWVIVQIHPKEKQEIALKNFQKFDEREYGSTLLLFYEKVEEQ
jgi:16S rRNA (guanine966-N2)-methyltransferase